LDFKHGIAFFALFSYTVFMGVFWDVWPQMRPNIPKNTHKTTCLNSYTIYRFAHLVDLMLQFSSLLYDFIRLNTTTSGVECISVWGNDRRMQAHPPIIPPNYPLSEIHPRGVFPFLGVMLGGKAAQHYPCHQCISVSSSWRFDLVGQGQIFHL
jgi:hypothetical protein